jgi:hypothetical protein
VKSKPKSFETTAKINRGDVSHTVAPGSLVLTTRDQVFTGEVNSLDYRFVLKKCNTNCAE